MKCGTKVAVTNFEWLINNHDLWIGGNFFFGTLFRKFSYEMFKASVVQILSLKNQNDFFKVASKIQILTVN